MYINIPPGSPPLREGYVYKLQRALYGLKQSPREWNNTLNAFMIGECGFKQLQCEKCLYLKQNSDGSFMPVCMYIEVRVIAYSLRSMFDSFIRKVKNKFTITQTDSLQKTLGFQIERMKTGGVLMHQHSYIQDVVKRFGMESYRSVETPFDPRIRLCKSGAYVSKSGVKSATLQGES